MARREYPVFDLEDVGVLRQTDSKVVRCSSVPGACSAIPFGTLRIPVWLRSRRIQRSSVE